MRVLVQISLYNTLIKIPPSPQESPREANPQTKQKTIKKKTLYLKRE